MLKNKLNQLFIHKNQEREVKSLYDPKIPNILSEKDACKLRLNMYDPQKKNIALVTFIALLQKKHSKIRETKQQ